MDDEDITAKLVGKQVTVTSVDICGEAIVREGTISAIKPRLSLDFGRRGRDGSAIFAGIGEAIYLIVDEEDRMLYRNEAALEAYQGKFLQEQSDRDALREQGVFYLDD